MDRKNFFLGMACIVGAFAVFFLTKPAQAPAAAAPAAVTSAAPTPPVLAAKAPTTLAPSAQSAKPVAPGEARRYVLENDHLKVTLTSRGGAIAQVELKKEFADVSKQGIVTFNAGNDEAALTLAVKNPLTGNLESVLSEFVVQPGSAPGSLVLVGGLADGTRLERTYAFGAAKEGVSPEPYALSFVTKLVPPAGKPAATVWVSTGSWQPTEGDTAKIGRAHV